MEHGITDIPQIEEQLTTHIELYKKGDISSDTLALVSLGVSILLQVVVENQEKKGLTQTPTFLRSFANVQDQLTEIQTILEGIKK